MKDANGSEKGVTIVPEPEIVVDATVEAAKNLEALWGKALSATRWSGKKEKELVELLPLEGYRVDAVRLVRKPKARPPPRPFLSDPQQGKLRLLIWKSGEGFV